MLILLKTLLLIAHGSRREQSNAEIASLAESLAKRVQQQFRATRHAFLELADPPISDTIDQMVIDGASEIVILPYFLSAGRHVYEDIPTIIEDKQTQHAQVKFSVVPYLGEAPDIIELLADLSQLANEK